MGRPTKLTPEVQTKVVQAISGGNYRQVAAEWAGIPPDTLAHWMGRHREPYLSFRHAVLEAEKTAEIRAVALVMKGAAEDPKHAEWWLERKFHERWGRRDRTEVTGAGGGPIQHEHGFDLRRLSVDQLAALREIRVQAQSSLPAVAEVLPMRALPPASNGNQNGSDG